MNESDIKSTHVLLIGAGNYPNWPIMNIPNVRANLEELALLLSDPFYCGIPKEKILVIQDQDVENTNSALQEFFDNIQTSKATVILYYSGHGLQSTKAMDDLFLATRNIKEARFEASSVKISELRKLFSDCVASKKILLLDCCYAGKITRGFMSDDNSENVAKLNEFDGTYIMAASSEYERARFDPNDPNSPTKFTGKLIDVIKNGIESDDEYCTLNSIYNQIRNAFLVQKDAPRPVQIGQNNIGSFPIFRNKKFQERIPRDEEAWNKASLVNNVIAYNAFIDEFPESKYKKEAEKLIQTIEDEEAWNRARDKDTIGGYRYYLSNYLKYAVEARQQLNLLVRMQEEEELWKSVNAENRLESFRRYLDKYPDGKYADLAKAQIDRLRDLREEEQFWNKLDHKSITDIKEYLLKFPEGKYYKSAKLEIEGLRKNEQKTQREKEEQYWKELDHQSIVALNNYLIEYPQGAYCETAQLEIDALTKVEKERLKLEEQKRLLDVENERRRKEDEHKKKLTVEYEIRLKAEEEKLWQKMISKNTVSSYKEYISNYPNGKYADEANKKIQSLLIENSAGVNPQSFTGILKYWKLFMGLFFVAVASIIIISKINKNSSDKFSTKELRDSTAHNGDTLNGAVPADTGMALGNLENQVHPMSRGLLIKIEKISKAATPHYNDYYQELLDSIAIAPEYQKQEKFIMKFIENCRIAKEKDSINSKK